MQVQFLKKNACKIQFFCGLISVHFCTCKLTNLIISSDFLLNPKQRQLVSPTTMAEVGILARNFGLAINSGEKALIRFQFFLQYYQLSTTHKYVSHMSGCARSIACHPCPALHVTLKVERALIRSQFYFAKLQTISDAYGRHMKRCTRAIACDSCTGLHVLCKMNTEAFRASC